MKKIQRWAAAGLLSAWGIGFAACADDTTTDPGGCKTDAECNDADDCTSDRCGGPNGNSCIHTPLDTPACAPQSCTEASDCDDAVLCTEDTCVDGVCSNELISNCCIEDAACTEGELCDCVDCLEDPDCAGDCVEDGTCDESEGCDCADCEMLETCGSGCMEFMIVDAPSAGFLDAILSNVGDAPTDYFQGFGLTTPGTYSLSAFANQTTDCMGPTPCIQLSVDNSGVYVATSGTLDLAAIDPIEAVFTSVVFHPATIAVGGAVTVDLEGQCLYLAEGLVPTPP